MAGRGWANVLSYRGYSAPERDALEHLMEDDDGEQGPEV